MADLFFLQDCNVDAAMITASVTIRLLTLGIILILCVLIGACGIVDNANVIFLLSYQSNAGQSNEFFNVLLAAAFLPSLKLIISESS